MIQRSLHHISEESRRLQDYSNRTLHIIENSFRFSVNNILTRDIRENLSFILPDETPLLEYGDMHLHEFLVRNDCSVPDENVIPGVIPYYQDALIELFSSSDNYLSRKYIFENICSRYCRLLEPLRGVEYNQNIDYIFGLYLKNGEDNFDSLLKKLKKKNYGKKESHKFFQIFSLLYATNKETDIKIIEDDCFDIIKNHRESLEYMDEELLLEYLHNGSIDSNHVYQDHERQYIRIPQVISGSYGEKSGIVNFLSGFIKSHYPSIYKDSRKKKQFVESVLNDGKKVKVVSSAITKTGQYLDRRCGNFINKAKIGFQSGKQKIDNIFTVIGETSFDLWLQGARNLKGIRNSDIDFINHKQILKQHIDFKTYLNSIESSQQVNKSPKSVEGGSSFYNYIHKKYKAKLLTPFINGAWNKLMALKVARSVTTSAKIVKFKNVVWILAYIGIEKAKDGIGTMQFAKNYKIGKESYNGFAIENNPILLKFFLENTEDIDIINTRINDISELKKLNKTSRNLKEMKDNLDILIKGEQKEEEEITCTKTRYEELRLEIELLSGERKKLKEKLHGERSNSEKLKNKEIRREIREKFSQVLIETHDHLNSALLSK